MGQHPYAHYVHIVARHRFSPWETMHTRSSPTVRSTSGRMHVRSTTPCNCCASMTRRRSRSMRWPLTSWYARRRTMAPPMGHPTGLCSELALAELSGILLQVTDPCHCYMHGCTIQGNIECVYMYMYIHTRMYIHTTQAPA